MRAPMNALRVDLPTDLLDEIVERVMDRIREVPARRFLSKRALADRYGVGERTIKTWREKGLPGVRVGREVMYDVEACDRWIESHA
jgi:ribosome-binding protein aMBF1 (putative translation factor)